MKKIQTFLSVLVLFFLFTGINNATGLLTEDFSYTAGDAITAHSWSAVSGSGTNAITVTTTGGATGLIYSGYSGSGTGLSVTLTTSGEDDSKSLSSSVNSGSIYLTSLVKITSAQATGDYFFHLVGTGGTSTFAARLYIKSTTGGFYFGLAKESETVTYESGTARTFGTTYLVVLKYTFNTGTTIDDQVSFFVNPSPLGTEPSTPTIGPITAAGTDLSTITAVNLRQGAAGSAPVVCVDAINAGTTWSDAVPTSGGSPTFSATGTLSPFSQTSASASAEQTYTISGTNLTNTVTVTPPLGFEISKTTGTGFVNSTSNLTFTAAQVMANPTIFVRLHSATPGSYSGSITHASSDFATVNQAASGSNTSVCTLSLTVLIQARYNGSIMVPDTVTAELHDASTFGLVDQNKELLSTSGTGTFTFSNAVNGTNYYIAVKHRNSIETWSASAHSFTSYALSYNFTTAATQAYGNNLILQSGKYCLYSGDVNQDGFITSDDYIGVDNDNFNYDYHFLNDLNGDGFITSDDYIYIDNNNFNYVSKNAPAPVTPTPVFTITGTLTSFSQTSSAASAEQTYSISGTALTANVTVVPPAGFEISKTTGTGYVTSSGSLVYTAANVMAGQTIYVRLHAGSTGSYSGSITHTSAISEFTQGTKLVSGAYTITPVLSITGTLTSFSQTSSTPSAEQTYSIGGTGLTANVTVVPPAGFEISKTTGTGFVNSTSSLVYTAANVMAGQTIYVRLNAPSANSYSGNITHTSASSEFTQATKAVSGIYSIVSGNVNLTMGNPTNATTDINFPHNYLLDKPQFCASYDRDRGIPNWTSWQLNAAWCNGPGVRTDPYGPDLTLPTGWHRVGGSDYSGSGFARGHMCPSADRINTQADNDALFVMTNLDPQNQDNNAGAWEGLESYERVLANAGNTLYILSGGYGAGGIAPGTTTVVNTISSGQVTVPAKLWKVIIVVPAGTGSDVSRVTTSTRTIGFLINNDSVAKTASLWGSYRVSVASIEALTGYTFFSNVPSSICNVIKATVDSGPTN